MDDCAISATDDGLAVADTGSMAERAMMGRASVPALVHEASANIAGVLSNMHDAAHALERTPANNGLTTQGPNVAPGGSTMAEQEWNVSAHIAPPVSIGGGVGTQGPDRSLLLSAAADNPAGCAAGTTSAGGAAPAALTEGRGVPNTVSPAAKARAEANRLAALERRAATMAAKEMVHETASDLSQLSEHAEVERAEMADVELPAGSKGKVFAVTRGPTFGLFSEWAATGIPGFKGSKWKTFKFNPRSPEGSEERRTGQQARRAALQWMAEQPLDEPERAAVEWRLHHQAEAAEERAAKAAAAAAAAAEAEAEEKRRRRARREARLEAQRVQQLISRTAAAACAAAVAAAGERRREALAEARSVECAQVAQVFFDRFTADFVAEVVAEVGTGRDCADHQRSAEAQARRRAQAKAKRAKAKATATAAEPKAAPAVGGESMAEVRGLKVALADSQALLKLSRKRERRATKLAHDHGRQSERRSAKAVKRKRAIKHARAVAGAARREEERARKRKQPAGEALHTGERKHQRLVGEWRRSGGGGGGGGGGRGGGGGGGGHGGAGWGGRRW